MNRRWRYSIAFLCLALLAALTACQRATPAPPTPVTVQLPWTHQAQSAGFYAADQKGYYAAEGLTVTFLEGGATVDRLAPVANHAAHFGVAGADQLMLARSAGKTLRAIAVVYRRSPIVFVTLATSGITRPQDFVGKKVRVSEAVIPSLHAMMERVHVRRDQYTEVFTPSDLALFASGDAPVWGVYVDSFVVAAQRAGYKVNLIYPDDYGVHFFADTLFTTDDLIAANPDLVRRFLAATLKGWTYVVENPTTVGGMVVKYAPQADAALETAKMTASIPLVNTGEDAIGWMKPEMWAGMEATLRSQGVLTATLDVTQVYTMRFVKEIYGK